MTGRRGLLSLVLAAAPFAAAAQGFPSRPVKVVIPYAPGGGTDIIVRAILGEVSGGLGQPLVVENRPGAATAVGTDAVAKAPADGYTLLASDSAFLINPGLLGGRLPYDTLRDFTGLAMMASGPVVLLAHPSTPGRTLAELLAYAKANPGKLSYASGGNGTSPHLAGELLRLAADVELVHVPYRGTAPALNDLLGGQVQLMFGGISSARAHVEAGALRALALTAARRNAAMPDVPTFAEAGLSGVDAESYWGLYAPAGTPPATLDLLSGHCGRALRTGPIQARLAGLGYEVIGNTPEEHTRQFRGMVERWSGLIGRAGITAD